MKWHKMDESFLDIFGHNAENDIQTSCFYDNRFEPKKKHDLVTFNQ